MKANYVIQMVGGYADTLGVYIINSRNQNW